jgi:hypothetical protein
MGDPNTCDARQILLHDHEFDVLQGNLGQADLELAAPCHDNTYGAHFPQGILVIIRLMHD